MDLRRFLIAGVITAALVPAAASFAKGGADDGGGGGGGRNGAAEQEQGGQRQRRGGRTSTTVATDPTATTTPAGPGTTAPGTDPTTPTTPGTPTSVDDDGGGNGGGGNRGGRAARTRVRTMCDITAPCPAGAAGTVTLSQAGTDLTVETTAANPGWTATVERATGLEPEVTFTDGTVTVKFQAEVEDGGVRTTVRTR